MFGELLRRPAKLFNSLLVCGLVFVFVVFFPFQRRENPQGVMVEWRRELARSFFWDGVGCMILFLYACVFPACLSLFSSLVSIEALEWRTAMDNSCQPLSAGSGGKRGSERKKQASLCVCVNERD